MMHGRAGNPPSHRLAGTRFLTEELAIDYETLPADGSLPRERTCMSGRVREARAPEMRARGHNLQPANLEPEILGAAVNPPSRRLAWTRFF